MAFMDKQRHTAQRTQSRRLRGPHLQPFISYTDAYSNYNISNLDQSLLSLNLSKKEKKVHRTNNVIQSKLNFTVDSLKREEKLKSKFIRCDANKFQQTSRVLNDRGRSDSLNVAFSTRTVAGDQKSSHFRSKSTPPCTNSVQLTCIIAPSTSSSSSIFQLPFNERKQINSRRKKSDKQHMTNVETPSCSGEKKTPVKRVNTWMSFVGQDAYSNGAGCKQKHADETSIDSEENQSEASTSQFKPIDSDECVKIVRKAKPHLHIPAGGLPRDSVDVPARVTSAITTRRNTVIPYTRGGLCLRDGRPLDARSRIPSADDLGGILKVERSVYAMNRRRLSDFTLQLTLPVC